MCDLYGVTRDGYYSWKRRGVSSRRLEDEKLYEEILHTFQQSGEAYGSPKITAALRSRGIRVSKKRIARIMQENGLKARRSRIYRTRPGMCHFIRSVPNRTLKIIADAPDKVWVGDITYIRIGEQWHYVAVVMDKFSRKIVGWSISDKRNAHLTWTALQKAIAKRRPSSGLFFHTDRGIEYRAFYFAKRAAKRGIIQSMNRPRRMNDNAFMESFFANFKAERIHKAPEVGSIEELKKLFADYVGFYNRQRIHSSIGHMTPDEYERRAA